MARLGLFDKRFHGIAAGAWARRGVTVAGGGNFTTTDRSRRNPRRDSLPILEGLAAVCGGWLRASTVGTDGSLFVSLAPAAYQGSATSAGCECPVSYLDCKTREIGSNVPGAVVRGSWADISIPALGLIEALIGWRRDGNEMARSLLAAHCGLLVMVRATGGPLPSSLAYRIRDVSDRIFAWVAYHGLQPKESRVGTLVHGPARPWPGGDPGVGEPGGLHVIVSDADLLARELARTPAAVRAAEVDVETALQRAVRWTGEIGQAVLFAGPASTGKTRTMLAARDGMPVVRTSLTAEADVSLAVGDLGRAPSGEWTPRLGRLSRVVRYAMLASIVVALRRGRRLPAGWTRSPLAAPETVSAIERLSQSPDDADAARALEHHAWPFDPDSWDQVNAAWLATDAASVGPVVRLVLDEIHDAATANADFQTLLKLALEDERVFLTELGGAGWRPMYCHNVHFAAAGNPDERGQFGRALRSRFAYTVAVGYPTREDEIGWHLGEFANGGARVAITSARPLSIADGVWGPGEFAARPVTEKEVRAAVDLGIWTREQYSAGRLGEGLDPRGVAAVCRLAGHLGGSEGLGSREAFAASAALVVDRLAEPDELGLPDANQREAVLQKIAQLAKTL